MTRESSRRDHTRHEPRDRDRDREHDRDRDRERERQRRRRGHRATDSTGELLPPVTRTPRDSASESPSPRKVRGSDRTNGSRSNPLSLGSLAKLDSQNLKRGWKGYDYDSEYVKEVRQKEARMEKERLREEALERKRERERDRERRRAYESDNAQQEHERVTVERREEEKKRRRHTDDEGEERRKRYTESERAERRERRKAQREIPANQRRRVVSGPLLEEGGKDEVHEYMAEKTGGAGSDGYTDEEWARRKRKRICENRSFRRFGYGLINLFRYYCWGHYLDSNNCNSGRSADVKEEL